MNKKAYALLFFFSTYFALLVYHESKAWVPCVLNSCFPIYLKICSVYLFSTPISKICYLRTNSNLLTPSIPNAYLLRKWNTLWRGNHVSSGVFCRPLTPDITAKAVGFDGPVPVVKHTARFLHFASKHFPIGSLFLTKSSQQNTCTLNNMPPTTFK